MTNFDLLTNMMSRSEAVRWQTDVLLVVRWLQSHDGRTPQHNAPSLMEQRCARILDAIRDNKGAGAAACRDLDEYWLLIDAMDIDPAEACYACR